MSCDYWKLDGKLAVPCDDVIEWGQWMETANRRVALTEVGPLRVSTVFIGLDHNFFAHSDRPLIFETMIFGTDAKHETSESYCGRYSTWDEAEKGHAEAIKVAQAMVDKASKLLNTS